MQPKKLTKTISGFIPGPSPYTKNFLYSIAFLYFSLIITAVVGNFKLFPIKNETLILIIYFIFLNYRAFIAPRFIGEIKESSKYKSISLLYILKITILEILVFLMFLGLFFVIIRNISINYVLIFLLLKTIDILIYIYYINFKNESHPVHIHFYTFPIVILILGLIFVFLNYTYLTKINEDPKCVMYVFLICFILLKSILLHDWINENKKRSRPGYSMFRKIFFCSGEIFSYIIWTLSFILISKPETSNIYNYCFCFIQLNVFPYLFQDAILVIRESKKFNSIRSTFAIFNLISLTLTKFLEYIVRLTKIG